MVETRSAARLRRGIARTVAGTTDVTIMRERLLRFAAVWRQRCTEALLKVQGQEGDGDDLQRMGIRLFGEGATSNAVTVSWQVLGGPAPGNVFFEVNVRAGVQSLGSFSVPGGDGACSFTVRRLQPLRWHRVRCRAVRQRPHEGASAWSNEVALKTVSLEDAVAAGRPVTADRFFAESERAINGLVRGLAPGDGEVGAVTRGTNAGMGALGDIAVKDLLDARSYRGGCREFARCGMRYSRQPESRDIRLRRMRIAVAAQELYPPEYAHGNAWSMGPFYHEARGRKLLEETVAQAVG